jgi:hypothetical protein
VDLLASCTSRTVLAHPAIAEQDPVSLELDPQDREKVAEALERVFEERGLKVVFEERTFALLVPTNQLETALQVLAELEIPSHSTSNEPAGEFNFANAPVSTAADVYGELVGWKHQPGSRPMPMRITLRTATPLLHDDAARAFEVLFAWNGIAFEPTGERTFRLVNARQPGQSARLQLFR